MGPGKGGGGGGRGEDMARYLARMEGILAEVQATHAQLLRRGGGGGGCSQGGSGPRGSGAGDGAELELRAGFAADLVAAPPAGCEDAAGTGAGDGQRAPPFASHPAPQGSKTGGAKTRAYSFGGVSRRART